MKVLCVKSRDKYTPDYVLNLQKMVKRHLPIPHEFICMTEHPIDGVTCVSFPDDMPVIDQRYEGWWYKVGLYKPGYFTGDKLYLDLDVVITDSLLPIVALLYQGPGLWARDDPSYSLRNPRLGLSPDMLKLLGGPGCVNSSVTLWHDDVASDVWTKFRPEMMDIFHGDQNWLSQVLWPDNIRFIPDAMVSSYKYHVLSGQKPTPIVIFHGEPKPDKVNDQWVRDNWR
jgi:hypothetical protein